MNEQDPISLVMLAYNEAETIEKEVLEFYETIIVRLPGSELIVAEDGSSDGTAEILQSLQSSIGIIHLGGKDRKGYARALIDAVLHARNNYIFFTDTGMKHDPQDFWKIYPLRASYDLIVGRKTNRIDQLFRQFLTTAYNRVLRSYFHIAGVYDADSGFRLFNQRVVEVVFRKRLFFTGFLGSEVVLRVIHQGLRYLEVPVSYRLRAGISRGLPTRVIPREIIKALRNLRLLQQEFKADRAGRENEG